MKRFLSRYKTEVCEPRPMLWWATRWESGLVLILFVVVIANTALSPYFLDYNNLMDSTLSFTEQALIVLPMTLLIIAREIDVSVASIVALAAVLIGVAAADGASTPVLLLVGITTGALAGLFNGTFVSVFRVHSIVVTIGTLSLFRGIAVAIVGNGAFTTFPKDFFFYGQGYIGYGIPFELFIYGCATIAFSIILHKSSLGRRIFAIGSNPGTARYSGVPVARYRVALFVLSGLMSGVSAFFLSSRLGSVRLNIATGWELQVITMTVLGGVSIFGGTGTILGVTLSVFLIGFLNFGLSLANVPGIVMNIYAGLMLIAAIVLPNIGNRLYNLYARRNEGF